MSTTKIRHQQEPAAQLPPAPGSERRRTGVTVAVLAVIVALVAAGVGAAVVGLLNDERPATPAGTPTADEIVAQDFLTAYAGLHADRAALYLADDASMPKAWGRDLQRLAAWNVVFLVRPCEVVGASSAGTNLTCEFDFHALGTDTVGREPFGENAFALRVDDGKVESFSATYGTDINGFDQYYEAIGSWIRANHPGDWAFMDSFEDVDAAELPAWLRLWDERLAQYQDRLTQYVEATTGD
jgi:hypothetical protein